MDIREQLPLEQQFELRVFENEVQKLSKEESQELLVKLRESMLYQAESFREILKNTWGIGKEEGFPLDMPTEG
jgi:uncharacterized protein YaaW (UPF0174 family)